MPLDVSEAFTTPSRRFCDDDKSRNAAYKSPSTRPSLRSATLHLINLPAQSRRKHVLSTIMRPLQHRLLYPQALRLLQDRLLLQKNLPTSRLENAQASLHETRSETESSPSRRSRPARLHDQRADEAKALPDHRRKDEESRARRRSVQGSGLVQH